MSRLELAALLLPLQDKHAILLGSLQHALAHLPRTVPADNVLDSVQPLGGSLHSTLTRLLGPPDDLDEAAQSQLFLPHRLGGFDYVASSTTRCHAAYCSAAARTVQAFADGHARWQLLDPAASAPVLVAWSHVHDAVGVTFGLPQEFATAVRSDVADNAQFLVSRWVDDRAGAALRSLVSEGRDEWPALQHHARMRSCTSVPGSVWLVALPTYHTLTMHDAVFEVLVHFRLGLSVLPEASVPCACLCDKDLTPTHMMGCPKMADRICVRYDLVAQAWQDILAALASPPPSSPSSICSASPGPPWRRPMPAGTSSPFCVRSRHCMSPVPTLPSRVPAIRAWGSCATVPLRTGTHAHAALKRDEQKRKKYRGNNFCKQFIPLSHETYGRLGKPAMALLSNLGDIVAAPGRSTKAAFINGSVAELFAALQQGNEAVFRMYRFDFAKVSGRNVVPGNAVRSAVLG